MNVRNIRNWCNRILLRLSDLPYDTRKNVEECYNISHPLVEHIAYGYVDPNSDSLLWIKELDRVVRNELNKCPA